MRSRVMMVAFAVAIVSMVPMVAGAALYNTRPATFGTSSDKISLQQLFDGTKGTIEGWTGGGYNAVTDQSNVAIFNTDPQNNNSDFEIKLEIAGNAGSNTVGLYQFENPDNRLELFSGADAAASFVNLKWTTADSGKIGDGSTYTAFSGFSRYTFGLYLQGPGGTFFSEDSLNNGNAQVLAYQSKLSPFNWLFAFEDLAYCNSDKDFNDLIISTESLQPVPEPGTMMLLGSGLVGVAGWGRRKFRS